MLDGGAWVAEEKLKWRDGTWQGAKRGLWKQRISPKMADRQEIDYLFF
jgi:hypothetical protein